MAGGDYGRVRHTFWTDPEIKRGLSPDCKLLLLYYFTNSHSNLCGLYYLPLDYAALETGLALDDVREWTTRDLAPFVSYDERTEEILVHRLAKHQVADELKVADKRVPRLEKEIAGAHSATLVRKFLSLYGDWPLGVEAPSPEPEAPSKPLRSHSSAVHGKAEQQKDANASLSGSDEPSTDRDARRERDELTGRRIQQVFDYWRQRCGHDRATLTPGRKTKIKARLKRFSVEDLCRVADAAAEDPFYQGENDRQTRFDWPETIYKSDEAAEKLMLKATAKPRFPSQVVVNEF